MKSRGRKEESRGIENERRAEGGRRKAEGDRLCAEQSRRKVRCTGRENEKLFKKLRLLPTEENFQLIYTVKIIL